eukprot:5525390-Prorocentrum_lima.AAC.1
MPCVCCIGKGMCSSRAAALLNKLVDPGKSTLETFRVPIAKSTLIAGSRLERLRWDAMACEQ